MPRRDIAPDGAPCWVELFSSDTDRVTAFYGEIFGWSAENAGEEYGGYINFSKGDVRVAGLMFNDGSTPNKDHWTTYLAVPDIDRATDDTTAHGGQVLMGPMQVMELGSMSVIHDPGSATVGLWQPGLHKGFGEYGEPGTANWFELHTRDYKDSVAFYETVFGWDTEVVSDEPEFRYTVLKNGEEQLAGIIDDTWLPEGEPATWAVYFGVDDVDVSLGTVTALGGQVIQPAEDTPYGRMATALDPTGATFKLIKPPS